jgi:spermidine synthase
VTAALLDFAIGFILLVIYRKRFRYSVMFYIMVCVMVMPAIFVKFDPSLITSGVFRSYKNMHPNEKIQVIDGKTATISFHESPVHYYVKTNGKADASMSKNREAPISSDELTQAATAFMPMAVKTEPYDAAMVGFGSGMGAHYLLADPLLRDFDCVEIEEAMMTLAKGFYPWNYRGYDDPRIHIYIDDATTFFHTNRRKYDMIISVPSNPWVSGVAGLFAHEFYAKMRRYMKPGALWVQWIQTYEFNDLMFLNILKALDTVFPYVSLYKSTDEPDIIMIASDEPVMQKGIGRFSTDTALVAEFNRIHRDPEFFGERNFLFTNKMLKSLLEGVKPNSLFIPMVDNKAEEARFVHSEAHIVQMFDSCEVCWQQYLDPEDYKPRREARVKAMLAEPKDEFLKTALLSYVAELGAAKATADSLAKIDAKAAATVPQQTFADTATTADFTAADSTQPEDPRLAALEASIGYQKFRENYMEWIRKVPLEARDTDEVYIKVSEAVNAGAFPKSFAEEFNIVEAAREGVYKQAALLIADFYDRYEMGDMDELFLRDCIVIALLADEPNLADVIYKNAIQKNESFFAVEKRLIEREIQQLRRKLAK